MCQLFVFVRAASTFVQDTAGRSCCSLQSVGSSILSTSCLHFKGERERKTTPFKIWNELCIQPLFVHIMTILLSPFHHKQQGIRKLPFVRPDPITIKLKNRESSSLKNGGKFDTLRGFHSCIHHLTLAFHVRSLI